MQKPTAILLVTDLSDAAWPALQRAVLLAAENQARLTVLSARTGDAADARVTARGAGPAEQRARRFLRRRAHDLEAGGDLRWIQLADGRDALQQILQAADDADLVVIGAAASCSWRAVLFGPMAERLVRLSRRPVLVVKRAPAMGSAPYRRALVPVDLLLDSAPAIGWAARIAPRAFLHLLHALTVPMASRLRMADSSNELVNATLRRARMASLHQLWCLAATVKSQRTLTTVAEGQPTSAVLQACRETAADLIVVGKSGRSTLGDFLLGSTTRHLLFEADTDLLVLPRAPTPQAALGAARRTGELTDMVGGG
jgi:nucleotide-binding universal stress UspA family protein